MMMCKMFIDNQKALMPPVTICTSLRPVESREKMSTVERRSFLPEGPSPVLRDRINDFLFTHDHKDCEEKMS